MEKAQGIQERRISKLTIESYNASIKKYKKEFEKLDGAPDPFPITHEKCMVFIETMREKGRAFSYLKTLISGFAHYCRENNLFDITKSYEFHKYKDGLMKTMRGASNPNAKEPITPQMLSDISGLIDPADRLQLRDMSMFSMMFYGFLRFSECANLKKEDIITEMDGKLRITVRFSKTDPSGEGESLFIFPSAKPYCAVHWYIQYMQHCERNNQQFNYAMSPTTFKRRLDLYLGKIPLEKDIKSYAGHSFRRGGACAAALRGVQDCMIKAHGRWKSACYTKYTSVQMIEAGSRIRDI